MAQRQLYSGLDLYDWRGTGPNGRTKAVDVDKWQQNQEDIRHLPGAFPVQSVVITDGQITPTAAALSVDTEGGAPADDLTAIAPGDLHAGMLLALCSVDTGRKVTIKNSAGASGIQTLDGKDVVLDTQYAVMLRLVSTESLTLWREEPGPLRLQLTVSTPDTLGGVKVQTGDDDGLEMIGDKLRVRQANATQRGSVLASETAKAGAVPLGGIDGKLDNSWLPFMLLNSRLVITESNASWAPPVTGWARICVIGGGGGGAGGGRSDFGAAGGGGGGSGEEVVEFRYLDTQKRYSAVIGAGGAHGGPGSPGTDGGKTQFADISAAGGGGGKVGSGGFGGGTNPLTCGYPGSVDVQILSVNTAQQKTLYGGGGGRGASPTGNTPNAATGYGAGGYGGYGVTAPYPTDPVAGGEGVQGCIVLDYFDPDKEAV